MKLAIFNVKYSPNLGDGLLCECLEKALLEIIDPNSKVCSIDLAGRLVYGTGESRRELALKMLDKMPHRLRRALTKFPIEYRLKHFLIPHYRQMVAGANAVVIGGGNLFSDADLNFPMKLSGVLHLASEHRLPVAIYGVGVSDVWSREGLDLVRRALEISEIKYVSVRDQQSKSSFDYLFSGAAKLTAEIVDDPGFLISKYRRKTHHVTGNRAVGLNVTSAIAIRYHSLLRPGDRDLSQWYIDVCRNLSLRGHSITVFTNGSPEDEAFLARIRPNLRTISGLEIVRVSSPCELSDLISGLSLLIGHRMHAIIPAYSYGVPFVPLRWDPKIDWLLEKLKVGFGTIEAIATNVTKVSEMVDDLISGKQALHFRSDLIPTSLDRLSEMSRRLSSG